MKKEKIIEIAASLLILLFIYASLSKLVNISEFRNDMLNQPFPKWMSSMLVWFVPGIEILISLALSFKLTRLWGLWGSAVLMGAFTIYTAIVLLNVFGRVPCSCGGVIKRLTWTQHLFFNAFFLLVAILGIWLRGKGKIDASRQGYSTSLNVG